MDTLWHTVIRYIPYIRYIIILNASMSTMEYIPNQARHLNPRDIIVRFYTKYCANIFMPIWQSYLSGTLCVWLHEQQLVSTSPHCWTARGHICHVRPFWPVLWPRVRKMQNTKWKIATQALRSPVSCLYLWNGVVGKYSENKVLCWKHGRTSATRETFLGV